MAASAVSFADSRLARLARRTAEPKPEEPEARCELCNAPIPSVHRHLAELEMDVEALLVNRVRGARGHWLVPLDECYALVGVIRTRWRGLSGGSEVWQEIDRFFGELDGRARSTTGRR